MNWKNLPGIREREYELARIQISKKALDIVYKCFGDVINSNYTLQGDAMAFDYRELHGDEE